MTNKDKREYIRLQWKLDKVIRSRGVKGYTIAQVIKMVSKIAGLDISRRSRAREIVLPRQVAHYIAIKRLKHKHSIGEIGFLIGGKTHGTVINSKKVIERYIETNDYLLNPYLPLLEKLKLL